MKALLRHTKTKVANLLEQYKVLRDNDKLLLLAFWNVHYNLKDRIGDQAYQALKEVVLQAPTPESIRRVRQKLNEEGHYIGDSYHNRQKLKSDVREWSKE